MAILQREASSLIVNGVLLPQVAESRFLENIGKHNRQLALGNTSATIVAVSPINTATTLSQTWSSDREKQGYDVGQIKIPAYTINAHFEYNKKEAEIFSKNVPSMSLQELLSSFCVQAINQRLRQAVFHGLSANEGILNNATEFTFGSDSNSQDKLTLMDPVFVMKKLLDMINEAMSETLNRGNKIVITSSLRTINYINLTIVPLMNYQEKGGGSGTITSTIQDVVKRAFNIDCVVIVDSTFESDSGDTLSVVIPSIDKDTNNEFALNYAGNKDSIPENTFIDTGSGAVASLNPEINGYISGNYDMVLTPGAVLRKEAVLTTTIQYQ